MTVFAVISEQGKAKGNLEYSSTTVRKYLLLEALGNGPLKSKFSRSKTCVALISRASFDRTEVGLYLLTFFTLRGHLAYVSEREWKILGTNEVTHPRNARMTEQREDRAGGFVEHNHSELESECRDQHFLSQGDAQQCSYTTSAPIATSRFCRF